MTDGAPDDDGPDDDGPPEAAGDGQRKRRRRRRRRAGGDASTGANSNPSATPSASANVAPSPNASPSAGPAPRRDERAREQPRAPRRDPREQRAREQRPRDQRPDDRDRRRDDRPRPAPVDADEDATADAPVRDPLSSRDRAEPATGAPSEHGDDDDAAPVANEAWGTDDGAPARSIALAPDLPADRADDLDPASSPLADAPGARLGEDVANVVGARFVPAGRISWFDAGDGDFAPGDRVIVDAERGTRLAWIATAPQRRLVQSRGMRRVIRRASAADLRGEQDDAGRTNALRIAKDKAAQLRLPLKVFRVEVGAGRLVVYYTSDDRLDLRDFTSGIAQATGLRPELRQLGVRDEAKAVGGIGTCGLPLCCTTWLPEFVPVSIKMAKDQGLVLSPTKVSGQCGRLKCCLVYEQAAYAELRKGLPKLGKRVIGARGEGRIVEVDVLRQRVRVSYGPGDTEVVPAAEVKPLFPSAGNRAEPDPEEAES